jgi:outer membrane immunogenic protein
MRTFVRTGSAMLALAAITGSALAADSGSATYNWSGFYAGVNAGVMWDSSDLENSFTGTGATRSGVEYNNGDPGFTGGGPLGYNWQINQFVLGVETDINYGNLSGDITTELTFADSSKVLATASYETDWFATLRGRAGFAFDNVLIYGTGGVAYSTIDTEYKRPGVTTKSDTLEDFGWVAGGGIEYAMDKWSLGAEYLYIDLPDVEYFDRTSPLAFSDTMDFSFSTVRATLKYHF